MKSGLSRRIFLMATAAFTTAASAPGLSEKVIPVTGGRITGKMTDVPGVAAWLGIPYAAPPVGDLRWKAPEPALPWKGIRRMDAFSKSPWAMPAEPGSPFTFRPISMDEDCLTLNVWAPSAPAAHPRPVMVWIYGGGFVEGTTDDPSYDGAQLAAQDVVYVSINYRVGIFGFFAHPELARESAEGVSGNYALLDQIAALRWVKANIAAFGGDPGNVTIMGQSAGAFSVAFHMVMPKSRGLFHRAIVQSGASMGKLDSMVMLTDGREMERAGTAFAERVRAGSLAELRRIDPLTLVKANHRSWVFHPALDGSLIPQHPFELIRKGLHADVPVIAGFNADEGNAFPPLGGGTPAGLSAALAPYFGTEIDAARRLYASDSNVEAVINGRRVFGDLIFNWDTMTFGMALARYGRSPVYFYHFSYDGVNYNEAQLAAVEMTRMGAFHGAEIGFALRNPDARGYVTGPEKITLLDMISGYWVAFARRGDPNGTDRPAWPKLVAGSPTILYIDGKSNPLGPVPYPQRLHLVGRAWQNRILEA